MPEVDLLATAKAVQKGRIRAAFDRAPEVGCQVSLGFVMDSRREDIDNLARLRDRVLETGTTSTTVQIRDKANQFHTLTVAELSTVVGEMVDFGLGLYSHKWQREQDIDACATIEEVEAVTW
jgi:hypothetical protein